MSPKLERSTSIISNRIDDFDARQLGVTAKRAGDRQEELEQPMPQILTHQRCCLDTRRPLEFWALYSVHYSTLQVQSYSFSKCT